MALSPSITISRRLIMAIMAFSFSTAISRRLAGKVALITGGASGIGEATAKLFAGHGAKVVVADIQDGRGESLCRQLGGGTNAAYVHCDVREETQVENAVDMAVSMYGRLDVMFNNAGVASNYSRFIDNTKEDFEQTLAVNVTGVFLGMKHAARVMIPAKSGSIISTASTASIMGGLAPHAYTCSKHAVVGLTKNAAVELGQFGIRVNCLSPSALATPLMTEFMGYTEEELEMEMEKRGNLKEVFLKKEDVANAALYLASDESRYVSGHNLSIDGGLSVTNSALQLFFYGDAN